MRRPSNSRPRWVWLLVLTLSVLLVSACAAADLEPPRVATATAQAAAAERLPTAPPSFLPAPSPTPGGIDVAALSEAGAQATTREISLWIDDPSPAARAAVDEIATAFAELSGVNVDVVTVRADQLPQLVETAVISGTLPDLILHPLSYSVGWAERGIMDPEAATAVVNSLERSTFDQRALDLVSFGQTEDLAVAAVPSEGWPQLIIYREDWFERENLAAPANYAALLDAAAALFQPDSVVSGIVAPTESDLASTQQVFEHLASANGCDLVNAQGEVALLHPACLEALDFYRQLINQYSPIGVQTEVSALNAYLAGRTGIIVATTAALPQIAGLDPDFQPICPECLDSGYLARNTSLLTTITGGGDFARPANFAELKVLGITRAADVETASDFARFWFDEAYPTWLAANPERKIPMRQGTPSDPLRFSAAWPEAQLVAGGPTLAELYGAEEIAALQESLLPTARWGFDAGRGELVTDLYEDLTLSPLLQEMLSGYFTSSQTVIEMQRAVANLIPGYSFPLPTQTSDVSD